MTAIAPTTALPPLKLSSSEMNTATRRAERSRLMENVKQQEKLIENKEQEKEKSVEVMSKFVGYFYSFMIQKMRDSLPEGVLNGGRGEKIFQQQMDVEMGDKLSMQKSAHVKGMDKYSNINPMTRDLVKQQLKSLDKDIEATRKNIVELETMIKNKKFSGDEIVTVARRPKSSTDILREFNERNSLANRREERVEMEIDNIKRMTIGLKVGMGAQK